MINQYRTLILNLPDEGNPNEFISPGFPGVALTPTLQAFYNLLFPATASRFYKQFLYYCYEQLVRAAGQEQFIYSVDPRVTYTSAQLGQYFQINQVGIPLGSSTTFQLLLGGSYEPSTVMTNNLETFVISQVGSTGNIVVYSTQQQAYLNGAVTSKYPDSSVYIALTFAGNASNVFPLGTTGLTGSIAGVSSNFGSTSNKTWTFTAQTPFVFDFQQFFQLLLISDYVINPVLSLSPNDISSQNLWSFHFNPVYRFAGLLNSYFVRVNALWPM